MFDRDHLIADCRTALAADAPELAIKEIVERAVTDRAGIERALGTPHQGELVVLHRSPELTILHLVWPPGMSVNPHDHRMWAVIGLYGGREDNTFHRRTPGGLAVAGEKRLETGDVAVLGRAIIHSVANPLRTLTGAIHVYGGDFVAAQRSEWVPGTCEERPYDVARARRLFADANERWRATSPGR